MYKESILKERESSRSLRKYMYKQLFKTLFFLNEKKKKEKN